VSFTVNLHELSATRLRVEYHDVADCLAITVVRDAPVVDDQVNLFLADDGWAQVLACCVRRLVDKAAQSGAPAGTAGTIVADEIRKAAQS